MNKNTKHISKFLSYVLRHKPEEIDLTLDNNGWASIDELLPKLDKKFNGIDLNDLIEVVETNNKQRFTFNDDKSMIRANQGHSIDIELNLSPIKPPEILYHGTVSDFLESIKLNGLQKRNRQHVHLSIDIDTATNVGQRRGKPIILTIQALKMHNDGYDFFQSKNGVWLTDHVPSNYLNL